MADKISYSFEEQLVTIVWVRERLNARQTMAEMMTVFWEWCKKGSTMEITTPPTCWCRRDYRRLTCHNQICGM